MFKIDDALNNMLKSNKRLKQCLDAVQIEQEWEKIMGPAIAGYTKKIEIFKRTLYISTDIAVLKNELSFQKAHIVKLVNDHFKEPVIDDVVIR